MLDLTPETITQALAAILAAVTILSTIVRFAANPFKPLLKRVSGRFNGSSDELYTIMLNLLLVIFGVLVCVLAKFGILSALGVDVYSPALDYVLSGVVIAQGSGFIHEALELLHGAKKKVSS